MNEIRMTVDSWLLRGKQEPDFEMRLAIYEELRAKRKEIERLTKCLKTANSNHEHFEREWYLRGDEIESLRTRLREN